MTTRRALLRTLRAGLVGLVVTVPVVAAVAVPSPADAQSPTAGPQDPAASIGTVSLKNSSGVGWIAESGLVVTSDVVVDAVGRAATFTSAANPDGVDCYVARIRARLHLALLRCTDLDGTPLKVATAYPTPGMPIEVFNVTDDEVSTTVRQSGSITRNDMPFMGTTRPQFSTAVGSGQPESSILAPGSETGSPVLGPDGRVVSTVLTSPDEGGLPIGTTPAELTREIDDAKDLPETFNAAAILTLARRAVIPVAAGFVIGLIWGVVARSGNLLAKTFGIASFGLVVAVGYTVFALIVVGQASLVG